MKSAPLVALVLIAGCTTVRATRAPGANLSQYHSFAIRPAATPTPTDVKADRTPLGAVIQGQIAGNLVAAGLTPATSGTPDLDVTYGMKMRQVLAADWGPYGGWWGWDWYAGWPYDVYEYTQGTLTVDFVDPRTNQVIWRGTAVSTVAHPENPSTKQVRKAVDKVMGKARNSLATAPGPTRL